MVHSMTRGIARVVVHPRCVLDAQDRIHSGRACVAGVAVRHRVTILVLLVAQRHHWHHHIGTATSSLFLVVQRVPCSPHVRSVERLHFRQWRCRGRLGGEIQERVFERLRQRQASGAGRAARRELQWFQQQRVGAARWVVHDRRVILILVIIGFFVHMRHNRAAAHAQLQRVVILLRFVPELTEHFIVFRSDRESRVEVDARVIRFLVRIVQTMMVVVVGKRLRGEDDTERRAEHRVGTGRERLCRTRM